MPTIYSLKIKEDGLYACSALVPVRSLHTSVIHEGSDAGDAVARMSVGMLNAERGSYKLEARFYLNTGGGILDEWDTPLTEVPVRGPSRRTEMILGIRFAVPSGNRYDVEVGRHPFSYSATEDKGAVVKMEWADELGLLEVSERWGDSDKIWVYAHRRSNLTPQARPS